MAASAAWTAPRADWSCGFRKTNSALGQHIRGMHLALAKALGDRFQHLFIDLNLTLQHVHLGPSFCELIPCGGDDCGQ